MPRCQVMYHNTRALYTEVIRVVTRGVYYRTIIEPKKSVCLQKEFCRVCREAAKTSTINRITHRSRRPGHVGIARAVKAVEQSRQPRVDHLEVLLLLQAVQHHVAEHVVAPLAGSRRILPDRAMLLLPPVTAHTHPTIAKYDVQ